MARARNVYTGIDMKPSVPSGLLLRRAFAGIALSVVKKCTVCTGGKTVTPTNFPRRFAGCHSLFSSAEKFINS